MKKTLPFYFTILAVILFSYGFQCDKERFLLPNRFACNAERSLYETVSGKTGVIVFYAKYNSYGVSFENAKTNDAVAGKIGLLCELNTFNTQGLKVIVSGKLKKFNANENVANDTDGQELYFLELTKITAKY